MKTSGVPAAVSTVTAGLPPREARSWLPFLLVWQAVFLILGRALLGRQWPGDFALLYTILILMALVGALVFAVKGPPAMRRAYSKWLGELASSPLREYAVKFSVGFAATLAAYWLLFLVLLPSPPAPIAYSSVWPMIAFQTFFVTPSEELVFRGWMPLNFDPRGSTWKIYGAISVGNMFTAATFAGFHYAAFGTDSLFPYLITFVLANVWLFLSRLEVSSSFLHEGRKPLGIPLTIGSHLAWNMCALGILTGGVFSGA
jgi:hypothetical protein